MFVNPSRAFVEKPRSSPAPPGARRRRGSEVVAVDEEQLGVADGAVVQL
jgi:hypothetical protein